MNRSTPHAARAMALFALLIAVATGAFWWWRLGQPVVLPDAPPGRMACVSYAPFREPGETPYDPAAFVSPQRIDSDLRVLSQRFDCVRTYSQGQGLSAVPQIATRYHMKVLLGIWLGSDARANARQVALGIATAKTYPAALRGVIVGNEVLLRGDLTEQQLAGYLRQVRAAIPASLPVTYADVWEFWLRHPRLAQAADYLTIHILPYWEDEPVPPANALRHVEQVYARVTSAFPGKAVMVGETGWPSFGKPRRAAKASLVNEARYLRGFLDYAQRVHMSYNVIETYDQPWKRAQEGSVGGYWGIYDVHGRPKFPMQGPVVEMPRWWLGWLGGALGAALVAACGLWRRRWRGGWGWAALLLSGLTAGMAMAWQLRQMAYACRNLFEWGVSALACVLAMLTAVHLARTLASAWSGAPFAPSARGPRLAWLFVLAWFDLLLMADGRYRDFPLGLFVPLCLGYVLLGSDAQSAPDRSEKFLAALLPSVAAVIVAQDECLGLAAWLWLGLNLAFALPVLRQWCGLRAQ